MISLCGNRFSLSLSLSFCWLIKAVEYGIRYPFQRLFTMAVVQTFAYPLDILQPYGELPQLSWNFPCG